MGGDKALAPLHGRPLIWHVLDAMTEALDQVVVSVTPDTSVLAGAGAEVWVQAGAGHHPLLGVVDALTRAAPQAVLVCPLDLPLVSAATISRLADAPGDTVVVARAGDQVQPLLARFEQAALAPLRDRQPGGRVHDTELALAPAWLEIAAGELLNVNTPEDLAAAETLLG
jgi:molybdopterin-guanine dinucleotide biosynthesis protein A